YVGFVAVLRLSGFVEVVKLVDDSRLKRARKKLVSAVKFNPDVAEAEDVQEASERVLEAKHILDQVSEDHRGESRQIELKRVVSSFARVRQHARASEAKGFDKLTETAQRAIERGDEGFDEYLSQLWKKYSVLYWRQPTSWIECFKRLKRSFESSPEQFDNPERCEALIAMGTPLLPEDLSPDGRGVGFIDPEKIKSLKPVVAELWRLKYKDRSDSDEDDEPPNIIRG
ncbi:MAG: hypothetical protein OXT74_11360, partial [Candidatus Poribacteria bacterium]|nr:hypothetical protein [Candidatus Poribacteria bacterium]